MGRREDGKREERRETKGVGSLSAGALLTKFENNLNRQCYRDLHWPYLLHTMLFKQIAEVKNIGKGIYGMGSVNVSLH